jgi:hypothetical protein
MFKSANNIFKNPTTYLYVSGVVALAALIISIIAMFTNDCKKSPFGDIMINGQHGNSTSYCVPISKYSISCEHDMDPNSVCKQGLTCKGIDGDQHGKCITSNKLNTEKDCKKLNPHSQPRDCSNKCNYIKNESDCTNNSSDCPCTWHDKSQKCTFDGGTGQGRCPSSMCCNPNNQDSNDDCKPGFICSQDTSLRGKCQDGSCHYPYTRKCVKRTGCSNDSCIDPHHGPHVAGAPAISPSDKCCPGLKCMSGKCVKPASQISSGSGSDIIINKKHININGNIGGNTSGSTRQNSTQPSAAPPVHHHSPPPSHSPSPSGPSGPSDSDDLTWLWITLGSVGGLVLLGLIIYFVTRKPKMGFRRPRMTGFGRPYPR